MSRLIKTGLVILAVTTTPLAATAHHESLLAAGAALHQVADTENLPLAIGGYDPTLYFAGGLPKPGDASISYPYEGQLYYFATYASRQSFIDNPTAFAPQYAGHCAFAMSEHRAVSADPSVFAIEDGKLFLFENEMKLEMWKTNSLKFRVVADKRWEVEAKNFSNFKAKF